MKENIVIIGGGPHAMSIIDIVEQEEKYQIAGITDTKRVKGEKLFEYPVLGTQDELDSIMNDHNVIGGIVALGDNYIREKVVQFIEENFPNFKFVKAIHPSVRVAKNATIGEGTVIMAGCIVNVDAHVGKHCIINTNTSFEHCCQMGDYSSLSAGVTTGGYFTLGKYSAIALGVTILDRVSIGENVVVGSGALVMKDIEDNVLAYGSPAKKVRKREPGERFLK